MNGFRPARRAARPHRLISRRDPARRALLLAVLAATLLSAGCGAAARAAAHRPVRWHPLPNRPAGATIRVGPDTVRMLHGGAATFRVLRSLIASARSEIDVEMYEFGRADLADALIGAHRRGIAVAVVVDPSVDVSAATEARLRAAGVDVHEYPVRRMMIDHVKLLVTDRTTAVVGGINWGTVSAFNHDYDAVIRGPAAFNLWRVFERDLVTCGVATGVPAALADPAIEVATTLPGADIRPLAMAVISAARQSLDLELYVLTDNGIVRALLDAAGRGVHVRVLLDPSERPSDAPAAALRAGGVSVMLYRSGGELLHAKLVVADSRTVLFGSANWSAGGFARNHECDIEIVDSPAVAADVEAAVSADWAASR